MTNNLTTQQSGALSISLSSSTSTSTLMNTKKDGLLTDGQMKGFEGKKRD